MATNFDPSGANDMTAIRDRITKTLSDATKDMTPFETFAQVGRAAAQAGTSNVTFGDALNAQKAERTRAMEQLQKFFREEQSADLAQKQYGLQEKQLGLAERGADRADAQLGLQQDQFGFQQEQAVGESDRAERRLGLETEGVNLRREELTYKRLQDAATRQDEDASAVVDALRALVPEDQRAIYASRMGDLPYDVNRGNVSAAIGRVRRDLDAEGGVPEDAADFKDVRGLRQEFTALSDDFIKVRDSYGTIIGLADQLTPALEYAEPANAGPGDLSFIFAYMKMLDPGSTVREGEMATAENARGVGGGIRNVYNNIMEGAKLTPAQRKAFISQSESIYKSYQQKQGALEEGFGAIAERNKFNKDDVIVDFAGPYRFRVMSDEDLTSALEGAKSKKEVDAIVAEFDRRAGAQ
jgi:hypothetical protein